MSKQQNDLSVQNADGAGVLSGSAISRPTQSTHQKQRGVSKIIFAAFFAVLLIGAGIYFSHDARLEASLYDDISHCNAGLLTIYKDSADKEHAINDGFDERFGLVKFVKNAESIGNLLTQCESRPQLALRVFRRSMKETNKDAKLIALYSVFFLIPKNVLDRSDIDLIATHLSPTILDNKEHALEVRKVAQRTLADLIRIKSVDSKNIYTPLPKEIVKSEGDWLSDRIDTLAESRNGVPCLRIRWSNPDTAAAWWKEHGAKGNWSANDQAWVLP